MSDAPERIVAWTWNLPFPSQAQERRAWSVDFFPLEQDCAEYIRADVSAARMADLERQLDATLMELAETQALELQHGAVIERLERQLAEAVRHNSGKAYPWPSLDAAEAAARAALTTPEKE